MPVPLFKHHFCRRDAGKPKAHAHAAYLSGTKLDDGYGRTADFTPKGGILHAEVWIPAGAPAWAKDRGSLWRSLEAREDKTTRKANAILAHKFIGALPHELSLDENIQRQHGKCMVVQGPAPEQTNRTYNNGIAYGSDPVLTAMHKREPVTVTQPLARPSQALAPAPGGNGISGNKNNQALRDLLAHARRGTTARPSSIVRGFKTPSQKTWPPAAVADWAAWGSQNPRKFFTLWPELSSGNPSPGGGL